ncbi:hypothetical protein LWF01_02885 [Saxibacter everestensis]|uniref:Uncharacterized protein n=1 Tax=Saxibacter everestensis TaxID=2909229 RepID=A0ABY8QWH4_9MICO|nr:hypothetical protein LWF01_02885 [Brevibacteriaceae bacterium ZFBP1038]
MNPFEYPSVTRAVIVIEMSNGERMILASDSVTEATYEVERRTEKVEHLVGINPYSEFVPRPHLITLELEVNRYTMVHRPADEESDSTELVTAANNDLVKR